MDTPRPFVNDMLSIVAGFFTAPCSWGTKVAVIDTKFVEHCLPYRSARQENGKVDFLVMDYLAASSGEHRYITDGNGITVFLGSARAGIHPNLGSGAEIKVHLDTDQYISIRSGNGCTVQYVAEAINAHLRLCEISSNSLQGHEPAIQMLIERIVQSGAHCVDVGAHVGIMTRLLAKNVGEHGKVYAFEAFPQNAKDCFLNLRNLRLDHRVIMEAKAVTDGSTAEVMLYPGRNEWSTEWNLRGVDVEGNKTTARISVPSVSLDQYFGERNVSFIKIDVEGSGTGVVQGMGELIARAKPAILFEYHGDDEREAVNLLRRQGYRLFDTAQGKEISSNELIPYHFLALHTEGANVTAF